MKKLFLSGILLFLVGYSQGALNAYFSYAQFDLPGKDPYVETYLRISGPSATLKKNSNNKFQAVIEVQWIYRQGEKIIHFDKYNLLSPEQDQESRLLSDFIDQQRVPLKRGDYDVELKITDKNSETSTYTTHQNLQIQFPEDRISISDIKQLESYEAAEDVTTFTRGGFNLVPLVTAFYPAELNSIKFYTEIYRASNFIKSDYLLRYFISNADNKLLLDHLAGLKKQNPEEVSVLMAELPIDQLPSGNYNLTVEVRDRENKLLAFKQTFFQRSKVIEKPTLQSDMALSNVNSTFIGPVNNPETLKDYVACLYPISTQLEIQLCDNLIAMNDAAGMKQYIYHFWVKKSPENPEAAWLRYKTEVDKVNNSYGARNKKGYETDRGRVYLQYGPPNSITADDMDPNARPYEIWHYYKLDNQSNRKFVFYTLDISTNDYRLLHSDAKGELQDPAWELKLHNRSQQFGVDMDAEKSIDIYGSKTKDNFRDPK